MLVTELFLFVIVVFRYAVCVNSCKVMDVNGNMMNQHIFDTLFYIRDPQKHLSQCKYQKLLNISFVVCNGSEAWPLCGSTMKCFVSKLGLLRQPIWRQRVEQEWKLAWICLSGMYFDASDPFLKHLGVLKITQVTIWLIWAALAPFDSMLKASGRVLIYIEQLWEYVFMARWTDTRVLERCFVAQERFCLRYHISSLSTSF